MLRGKALGDVPHGFCTALDHGDAPDPDWIVAGGSLVLLKQVHSGLAIRVDTPFADYARPEVDGMATATGGLVLGIVTADCAPVLFADASAGVIGAAHAGWRGAIGGVLEATLVQMEALGADRARIAAVVGPTIAQASYEVDAGFHARFCEADPEHARFFVAGKADHHQFDLPAFVTAQLAALRLGAVETLDQDTYASPDKFHSFRRATHRGEPTYGRQYSLIALPPYTER